jgi:hypothetical protein
MCLWAEALDIAHATRMKLISDEKLCRGVTAFGNPVRSAFYDASERDKDAGVRPICQMLETAGLATHRWNGRACTAGGRHMKFLDWFKRKPDGPKITFTAEIRVGKPSTRTDIPEFCVEGVGDLIIDMRPLAEEVLQDYPQPVDIDRDALARLAVKGYAGRHIKVAELPEGIDRKVLKRMIGRIDIWSDWPRRHEQLQRGEGGAFPKRKFKCGEDACAAASAMDGQTVTPSNQQRLPLKGCWQDRCFCDYQLVKRDGTVR